jgi:secreted PhoX family phosphatase
MNDLLKHRMSRRSILKGAAAAVGVAVIPAVITSKQAFAAKASKAAMQYQDKPKEGKKCSECIQYIPGKTPTTNGTCKVVEGSISPNGWCIAFAPKA